MYIYSCVYTIRYILVQLYVSYNVMKSEDIIFYVLVYVYVVKGHNSDDLSV